MCIFAVSLTSTKDIESFQMGLFYLTLLIISIKKLFVTPCIVCVYIGPNTHVGHILVSFILFSSQILIASFSAAVLEAA